METELVLANLHVIPPAGVEHIIPIIQSPFCIGRGERNDLMLAEEQIARHHVCLRFEGDQIQLVDMGSESGTWIGVDRLEANQVYVLAYHQPFNLGSYQLRVEPTLSQVEEETDPVPAVARPAAEVSPAISVAPRAVEPLVETSPGGRFSVALKTPQLTVTPGTSTNVSILIINQSGASAGYRIAISGIPKAWLPAPPPLVELPAGARQEVTLTIHPPRIPESRAQNYRLRLQVASQSALTETVDVWVSLAVSPYIAFSSALHPPRTGPHDAAQVVVRNMGNAPQRFILDWRDPQNYFEFRPAELDMKLSPGETAAAEFRAIPLRRWLFGGPRTDVYTVKITPEGGTPQSHTGQIVSTGLLPIWVAVMLLLFLAVCLVGTSAIAFARLGPTPTITTTLSGTTTLVAVGTGTPVATSTIAGLDSDHDGLADEDEARFGTDPRNGDTDRDGLSDYDEVRRGTSPTIVDTDGDSWLDGQETRGCSDPRNPDTDGDGQRDNVDPDPCRLPTTTPLPPTATPTPLPPTLTPLPTQTPAPTLTPLPTGTPLPTLTPLPTNTLPPTIAPTPIITEWRGEYFGNVELQGAPLLIRNDGDVNFNWGNGSPDPLVPNDYFSARWTRTLVFENRTYRFTTLVDDGVRIFIDNNLAMNEWHPAPATPPTYTFDVPMSAGQHEIRVEYYEAAQAANIQLRFEVVP